MRVVLALVGLLALARPALAQTPTPLDRSDPQTESVQPASAPLRLLPAQPPWMHPSAPPHCCSVKGGLIGAAIGTGLGLLTVYNFDDSAHRSEQYVPWAMAFGGLGAFIGAHVGSSNLTRPAAFPVGKHVGVGPVVSRQKKGGAMSVRF